MEETKSERSCEIHGHYGFFSTYLLKYISIHIYTLAKVLQRFESLLKLATLPRALIKREVGALDPTLIPAEAVPWFASSTGCGSECWYPPGV